MDNYFQILLLVILGIILLWGGSSLFYWLKTGKVPWGFMSWGSISPGFAGGTKKGGSKNRRAGGTGFSREERSGRPQPCPVCSAMLEDGKMVSTVAFPASEGRTDRFMHIRGCVHCLAGKRERLCPVCQKNIAIEDVLICRLFDPTRTRRRSHVHVMGCTQCSALGRSGVS